ncbi:hypothetical protein NDU88_004178 [Pleurodeles waltl]|uniref:Uncharacterized protein n=1 Tax=Pleurodeles waltl TaxID=8319 RepID=A0AAV7M7L1_PLEWA|nr:hypothetical protein NDU88_004178 [Pleurodeles waltl]
MGTRSPRRCWGEWTICGAATETGGKKAWPRPGIAGDAGDLLGPARLIASRPGQNLRVTETGRRGFGTVE